MDKDWGEFTGDVVAKWLTQPASADKCMELVAVFQYTDPQGKQWEAHVTAVVDGASIPRFFWSLYPGSPFVGDYRRASVLHDVEYRYPKRRRARNRKEADQMFYRAMRRDDVGWVKASVMYAAVRIGGLSAWHGETKSTVVLPSEAELEKEFEAIRKWIEAQVSELTLDALDNEIDARLCSLAGQDEELLAVLRE